MASRRKKKRVIIHEQADTRILDIGEMEIWDGADLALLRDTLTQLIEGKKCRSVGVNMSFVKYIPSGFFGMLFDWHEKGVAIRLYRPQPNVRNMLWFRRFFAHEVDDCHLLFVDDREPMNGDPVADWEDEKPKKVQHSGRNGHAWHDEKRSRRVAAANRD